MEGQAEVNVIGGSIKAFFQPLEVNKKSLLIQPTAGNGSAQSRHEMSFKDAFQASSHSDETREIPFQQQVTISSAGQKQGTPLKERSCNMKERRCSTQPKHPKPKWSLTCKVSSSSKWLSDSSSDFEDSVNSLLITETKQTQKRRKKKNQGKLECKSTADRQEGDKTRAVEPPKKEVQECESDCIREGNETFEVHINCHSEPWRNLLGKEDKSKTSSAFDILMTSQKVQRVEDQRTESSLIEWSKAATQLFDYKSNTLDTSLVSEDSETTSSKLNVESRAESELVIAGDKLVNEIIPGCSEASAFDFLMKNAGKMKVDCDMKLVTESGTDAKDLRRSLQRGAKKKSFTFLQHSSRVKEPSCLLESQSKAADSRRLESENTTKPEAQKRKKKKTASSMDKAVVSSIGEMVEDVVVLESRKERRRSKVSRQTRKETRDKTSVLKEKEKDKCDVSSSNVSGSDQADDKPLRKMKTTRSGRKSVPNSIAESRTTDTMSDQSSDSKDFEPAAKRARRQSLQKKKKNRGSKEDMENKQRSTERNSLKSAAPQQLLPADNQSLPDSKEELAIAEDQATIDPRTEKSQPTPLLSSSDNQEVATDSSDKDKEESKVNDEDATARMLCKDPKNLAAIFLRKKPASTSWKTCSSSGSQETGLQTSLCYSTSPVEKTITLMDIVDHEETNNEVNHSPRQEKSAVDNEATNKAFKALFTGVRLQRTLSAPGRTVPVPAPLPSVSHVSQRSNADPVDSYFWNLSWPPARGVMSDNWISEDSTMPILSTDFLPKETAYISERREEYFPSRLQRHMLPKEVILEMFTEAVVKKLLSELTLFYPGVPLRKLYKRYKSKQENYKAINVIHENQKQISEKKSLSDILETNVEPSFIFNLRRIRGKWKLCSANNSYQEKTSARKGKDFIASESQETGQSAKHCSLKRCREEEGNEESKHQGTKERRLSRRLQKKKGTPNASASLENDRDKMEEPEGGSRRKKRRRTANEAEDDKTTVRQISEQEMSCNMSAVCKTENKLESCVTKDTLWTELYRPLCSTEVMANASAVSKLNCWLEKWKIKREKTLRKELHQRRRLLANERSSSGSNSRTSSQNSQWWDEDSDSDFQMSDASGDSDTEGDGLSTAMFISGPKGTGKTAMVYACAEELGYKVFEVNCASKRTGKQILSQLEEATQSHLVISSKPGTVNKDSLNQPSFTGLFNKLSDIPPSSSPLQAFLQPKGKKIVDKKDKERGQSGKVKGKPLLKQSSQAGVIEDTKSCSNLSTKPASLILFEEVDIIFEEDKSFWMAVNSFMQNAKCPIVLISTEGSVDCEGKYECINLKQPSVNLLSGHLQLVALVNGIFVNPDDLKSLVAVNNCDIRKSLMTLQFWVESGGGVMMQYKRPSNVGQNSSSSSTLFYNSQRIISNNKNQSACAAASLGVALDNEAAVINGLLDNAGEESMFLSLSDWQAIKSRGGYGLQTSGRGIPGEGNSNSNLDIADPKHRVLIGTDGSTDSIYEINTDTSDSQQSASSNKEARCGQKLPVLHGLLFESAHGLLNCVADSTKSSLTVLQKHHPDDSVKRTFSEELHLTHFTQAMGADVIQSNLNDLVPLFIASSNVTQVRCKQDEHTQSFQDKPTEDSKGCMTVNLFSDSSLFDDGTGVSENKEQLHALSSCALPNGLGLEEPQKKTGASLQHFTDTGICFSQLTDRRGEGGQCEARSTVLGSESRNQSTQNFKRCSQEKKWVSQALEVFQQFAETMSFADAFCPGFPTVNAISTSLELGWWNASLKPGLTDKHVTVRETADWSTRDTRASIRGALEVACLESCHVKVERLTESSEKIELSFSRCQGTEGVDKSPVDKPHSIDVLAKNLPPGEPNSVLRFTTCSATETSGSLAFRRKLYRSLNSCIPTVHYCNHRSVVSDYLPALRLLCYTERMREAANLKRRFLHYLDSNSFPLSQSTKSALAASYMAP